MRACASSLVAQRSQPNTWSGASGLPSFLPPVAAVSVPLPWVHSQAFDAPPWSDLFFLFCCPKACELQREAAWPVGSTPSCNDPRSSFMTERQIPRESTSQKFDNRLGYTSEISRLIAASRRHKCTDCARGHIHGFLILPVLCDAHAYLCVVDLAIPDLGLTQEGDGRPVLPSVFPGRRVLLGWLEIRPRSPVLFFAQHLAARTLAPKK